MIPLESKLENREFKFADVRGVLGDLGYALGGGWEYDRGSFDRALDGDKQQVWLRLPFTATMGHIDAEQDDSDAVIRFGQPLVLRHVYEEGVDQDAGARLFGGLFDQFSAPADPDAEVGREWAGRAAEMLRITEGALLAEG